MQVLIAAIGKLKSGPEQELYQHYARRIPWKLTLKEYEIKKPLAPAQRKMQEAELLLAGCKDAEHVIALDERGRELTSPAFAAYLSKVQDSGARTLAFIIGGADGLHETALSRAQLTLSFGRITWPHLLVRGLLAEQLYRAHTILNHHPYHRQ